MVDLRERNSCHNHASCVIEISKPSPTPQTNENVRSETTRGGTAMTPASSVRAPSATRRSASPGLAGSSPQQVPGSRKARSCMGGYGAGHGRTLRPAPPPPGKRHDPAMSESGPAPRCLECETTRRRLYCHGNVWLCEPCETTLDACLHDTAEEMAFSLRNTPAPGGCRRRGRPEPCGAALA